jgi:hypothetical protein
MPPLVLPLIRFIAIKIIHFCFLNCLLLIILQKAKITPFENVCHFGYGASFSFMWHEF